VIGAEPDGARRFFFDGSYFSGGKTFLPGVTGQCVSMQAVCPSATPAFR